MKVPKQKLTFNSLLPTAQTAKIGSLVEVQDSEDPEGLRVFYYLVQDLKVSDWNLNTPSQLPSHLFPA